MVVVTGHEPIVGLLGTVFSSDTLVSPVFD